MPFFYEELFSEVGTLVETGKAEAFFSMSWSPFIAIFIGFVLLFIAYKLPSKIMK